MSGGGGKGADSGPAVLLVNSMGTGGAERAVAAVAACLRGRGRDLRVLCLERAAPGSAIELDPPAVELSSLGSGGSAALKLAALPFLARTLAAYLLKVGAGTVMSHLFRANFVNVMARDLGGGAHRAAQSATYRAILVNHTRVSRLAGEGLSGRVNAALTRRLYPRADLVASVSRASAAECAAFVRIPEARSIVLYNPVDCAAAVAAVAAAAQSRPRPAVVALGRLVALKRFGDLVEAFARLAPDYPELELDIVGEGPERSRLEAQAAASGAAGRIRFPGRVADPFPALAGARVFVSASEVEGFGIAIVEALAAGLPVVASDCAYGPREILAPRSDPTCLLERAQGYETADYGLLYPVGSVESLEAALRRVLDDASLASALAAGGPSRAADFDIERAADAYEALLYPSEGGGA
ncbi:MAG: glycosyltransferase [Rectinemataceae bacterium]